MDDQPPPDTLGAARERLHDAAEGLFLTIARHLRLFGLVDWIARLLRRGKPNA